MEQRKLRLFIQFIDDMLGKHISEDDVKLFSDEEIVDLLKRQEHIEENKFDWELFWIQRRFVALTIAKTFLLFFREHIFHRM